MVNAMEKRGILPNRSGFTLLELMIVITVIGVLAAIATVGAKSVIDRARKAAAQNDAFQLKNAIGSYFTEYRRFPTREIGPESATSPILSDHRLMDILLASNTETGTGGLNPRRSVSFSARKAIPIGNGRFRSGVELDSNGGGILWDPWGNQYRVLMDLDQDSRVPAPPFAHGVAFLPVGVAIWSPGKDGDDSTETDNVTTW